MRVKKLRRFLKDSIPNTVAFLPEIVERVRVHTNDGIADVAHRVVKGRGVVYQEVIGCKLNQWRNLEFTITTHQHAKFHFSIQDP